FARGGKFGITVFDCRRHDHDLRRAEIGRVMADRDGDALLAQALDIGVLGLVGALHAVAQRMQRLGDAAHADAANADKMHEADGLRHLHARISPLNSSTDEPDAIASVRSASNLAASGRPTDRAAAAMAERRSGACMKPAMRSASSAV